MRSGMSNLTLKAYSALLHMQLRMLVWRKGRRLSRTSESRASLLITFRMTLKLDRPVATLVVEMND